MKGIEAQFLASGGNNSKEEISENKSDDSQHTPEEILAMREENSSVNKDSRYAEIKKPGHSYEDLSIEKEIKVENIYEKVSIILEKALKSYTPSDSFPAELFGSAYSINHIQRDRIPENTGEIDDIMKPLTFICLEELRPKYPEAADVFKREFFDENDSYLQDDITTIFKKYNNTERSAIFGRYSKFMDAATSTLQYMKKEIGKGKTMEEYYADAYYENDSEFDYNDENLIHYEVSQYFLEQGNELLKTLAHSENTDTSTIFKESDVEIDIFKTFFKKLKEVNKDILHEMKSARFHLFSGPELKNKGTAEIDKMKKIYLENYQSFPEEFKQKIIQSLESKLDNPLSRFYVLYHKNDIVAFNSFTPNENGELHFANFNVDPEYSSSKLGEAMMEASLDEEAKASPIFAEAVPGSKIADTYLNKKDFQKTGEIEVGGVTLWEIRRERTKSA